MLFYLITFIIVGVIYYTDKYNSTYQNAYNYTGSVTHTRLKPKDYKFTYDITMDYFNIEKPPKSWMSILTFRTQQYISDELNESLYQTLCRKIDSYESKMTEVNGSKMTKSNESMFKSLYRKDVKYKYTIYLLTNLSFFGYAFNPISVYYCFSSRLGKLEYIILEVHNIPWGEKCLYIFKVIRDHNNNLSIQNNNLSIQNNTVNKQMHVSPFNPHNNQIYKMRFPRLTQSIYPHDLNLIIDVSDNNDHLIMSVNYILHKIPFKGLNRLPRSILTVIRIHYQAFILFLKGFKVFSHPHSQ
jgi:DUF1365 family protein